MIYRIFALVIKEFLAIFRDKRSRLTVIVPPIVQLFVFSYAATYDLERVPYAVYNEDQGSFSREFMAHIEGSPNFRKVADIQREADIAPLVDSRKALVVIHMDRRFSRDVLTGRPGRIQVILDGRNSNTAMVALNYVRAIVMGYSRDLIQSGHGTGFPAVLETRAWYNPNLESRWFIVPGILGVITLLVTLITTALSVAREREHGTFDQLLVTPLRPVEILIGKSIPGFIIGSVEGTACLLVAAFWFKVPLRGSLFMLYGGLSLFLLSAVGVGLLISSLSVTQQQGLLGVFLFMVPAVILSGFTTPIGNMPVPVQHFTLLNPVRYFMVVLRGVFLENAPPAVFFRPVLAHGRHRLYNPDPGRMALPAQDQLTERKVRFGDPFRKKNPQNHQNTESGHCVPHPVHSSAAAVCIGRFVHSFRHGSRRRAGSRAPRGHCQGHPEKSRSRYFAPGHPGPRHGRHFRRSGLRPGRGGVPVRRGPETADRRHPLR